MLSEEVKRYRELSGDNNPNTPISRIGGYLDGYEKAMEQEPCEDAISRQAVLKTLDDMDNVLDVDRTIENYKDLLKECYEVLPSVNPHPKTDMLDKIRAEIEALKNAPPCFDDMFEYKYAIDDVLAIIDKYKAETE